MESSINFGLSALMWGEINIQNGRVQQTNFDNYQVLRMDDAARIDTYVVDSKEAARRRRRTGNCTGGAGRL